MLFRRGRRVLVPLLLVLACLPLFPLTAQEASDLPEEANDILEAMADAGDAELWDLSSRLAALGQKVVPVVKPVLAELSPRARLGVAGALVTPQLGENTLGLATLVELSGEGNPKNVRIPALGLIGMHGGVKQEPHLLGILDETLDARVRIAAAKALWEATRNIRAKDQLKDVLRSQDRDLRIEGAIALGEIGDMDSAKEILESIRDEPTARGRIADSLLEQDVWRERAFRKAPAAADPKFEFSNALLQKIEEYIRLYYNDSPEITDVELLEAAARGIAQALDPHSLYLTPKERFDWTEDLNPVYGGIGSYVNFVNDVFTIIRPMFGGPAYKMGLKPGDAIIRVDGWETSGHTTKEIVNRLRGEPDTKVRVTIYRKGWKKPREFDLERKRIHVPTVDGVMLPGGVGYVRLSTFGRDSAEELDREMQVLEKQGMKGMILDLRMNSGGYLDTAQKISGLFLPPETLVMYWEGRNKRVAPRREYRAESISTVRNYPLTVLVNEASASASEIVSGSLKHYERAELVGMRTYGKGSVQNLYPLYFSPPAEPYEDVNNNGVWDGPEPFEDLNDNGRHDARERYFDRNRNHRWDDGEPYTDENGNGAFDFPAIKLTIAKYYLPSGVSPNRRKTEQNGRIVWIGGVEPNAWIAPEEPDGWRNEALAQLEEANAFENYLDEQYKTEGHSAILEQLAEYDGGSYEGYPDFEAFYSSLDTRLSRHDVWWWLRMRVRKKVGDEMGRELVGDYELDQQLQVGILRTLRKLGVDPETVAEYRLFAGKQFPEVPEDQRTAGVAVPRGR